MVLGRITNLNITQRDQNPRHPPRLSRERFTACNRVINLISINKDETLNRKVMSSKLVAACKPGWDQESSQGRAVPICMDGEDALMASSSAVLLVSHCFTATG